MLRKFLRFFILTSFIGKHFKLKRFSSQKSINLHCWGLKEFFRSMAQVNDEGLLKRVNAPPSNFLAKYKFVEIYWLRRQLFRPNLSQTSNLRTREFHPNHDITSDCPRNFSASNRAINSICHCVEVGKLLSAFLLAGSALRAAAVGDRPRFTSTGKPRIILYVRNRKLIEFTWHFSEAQPLRISAEKNPLLCYREPKRTESDWTVKICLIFNVENIFLMSREKSGCEEAGGSAIKRQKVEENILRLFTKE